MEPKQAVACGIDYTKHVETPVRDHNSLGRKIDIVIFACECGHEDHTWQIEVTNKIQFGSNDNR